MYRIPLQDLASSDDAQFGLRWEARIPVPIAEIEEDLSAAFQSRHGAIKTGDQVTVGAFDPQGGQWRDSGTARLREMATYRIVTKGQHTLEAIRIGDVLIVPEEIAAPAIEPPMTLQVVPVESDGNKSFEVRDSKGNVLEQFADQKQADDFAKRESDRGMSGVAGLQVKRAFGGRFKVVDSAGDLVETFPNKAQAEAFVSGGGKKKAA